MHSNTCNYRDALSLHYGLLPLKLATVEPHFQLTSNGEPYWGFPTICHNEVCDLTATLLTEVCHNVATEPPLQPITTETFPHATANTTEVIQC